MLVAAEILKSSNRQTTSLPQIEMDQPVLLKAIVDIVTASSAAQDRRRCEKLRTVTTLDDLTTELHKLGFKIKSTIVAKKREYRRREMSCTNSSSKVTSSRK